uniref:RNA-directed DNA polymerase n=1 Tax=Meloidogyne incognita TaxID=6306 RepID=A0A914LJ70_MELIC
MAYDVDIIYRPGKKNHLCDHMSRYIGNEKLEKQIEVNLIKIEKKISADEMILAQEKDEEIQKIKQTLEENPENEKYWEFKGVIFVKEKGEPRILVPENLRKKVMEEYHNDTLQGGHLGVKRTLEKIKRNMFWDKMGSDVNEFVKNCDACQKRKVIGLHQSKEPITPMEPSGRPFQRIHVDLMGPVPMAKNGYKCPDDCGFLFKMDDPNTHTEPTGGNSDRCPNKSHYNQIWGAGVYCF